MVRFRAHALTKSFYFMRSLTVLLFTALIFLSLLSYYLYQKLDNLENGEGNGSTIYDPIYGPGDSTLVTKELSLDDFCNETRLLKLDNAIDVIQITKAGAIDFQMSLFFRPPNEKFEITFLNDDGTCSRFEQGSMGHYPIKYYKKPVMVIRRPITNDPKEYINGSCMRFAHNEIQVKVPLKVEY
jgi:hypothetical protein